jgi:kynurenine 3-monooxygenase
VTVVGAGLVGSLWASFLARRGHKVRLLERREDLRRAQKSEGKSINLAISERGLFALRSLGLEERALRHAIPMRGRMMHSREGVLAFQPYGKDDSQCINSISRGLLNGLLMTAAEETGQVEILFRRRVTEVAWASRELSVLDEGSGERTRLTAPILFGTDGSGSAIRAQMGTLPGHSSREELLSHGYKELTLPAGPNGSFLLEKHALHIWPRGSHMLIALPNEDGSFTCTLFLPFKGPRSFEALTTAPQVQAFFEAEFGDAAALIPDLAEQFFAHPTGAMVTVKSAPWNVGGQALLLGDAAHAIVPFYGQGMNCGFEDCVELAALLEQMGWAEAFEAFSQRRKVHADAIADMAVENFVEMRDKVGDPRFLLEKQVERFLLRDFPEKFLSRYSLVSFSRAPYDFARRVGEIAGEIVRKLCEGLDRAEDVNREAAASLIEQRLTPYVRNNEYGFRP